MKKKLVIILGISLISASVTAFAATYGTFSTTVGKFNGSGYTSYLQQQTTGASPSLQTDYVGGDYLVDVRAIDSDGSEGSWTRNLGDNTFIYLSATNNFRPGDNVRLQFSNDLTTTVDVQVSGSWATH